MKKGLWIIPVILTSFLLNSCNDSNNKNLLEENARKYIEQEFEEIISLKTVELTLNDSVTMLHAVNAEIERLDLFTNYLRGEITCSENEIKYPKNKNIPNEDIQASFQEIKNYNEEIKKNQELIDFLKNTKESTGINSVCAYKYFCKIEAKMKTEDIEFVNFILLCDKDYNIIQVTKDPSKVDETPCTIPGYDEKQEELNNKYHYYSLKGRGLHTGFFSENKNAD